MTADVGGLLAYGPTVALELGGPAAFFVRGRMVTLGLAANLVAASTDDKLQTSYGIGGGFRYYTGKRGSRQGFYFGISAEYLKIVAKDGDRFADSDIEYKTSGIVTLGEVGYRWLFGERFTLGVGGQLGYLFVTSADVAPDAAATVGGYENTMSSQLVALPNLELGVAF